MDHPGVELASRRRITPNDTIGNLASLQYTPKMYAGQIRRSLQTQMPKMLEGFEIGTLNSNTVKFMTMGSNVMMPLHVPPFKHQVISIIKLLGFPSSPPHSPKKKFLPHKQRVSP